MNQVTKNLDYAGYWRLMRDLTSNSRGLVFTDGDGDVIWSSSARMKQPGKDTATRVLSQSLDGILSENILSTNKQNGELAVAGVVISNQLACLIIAVGEYADNGQDSRKTPIIQAVETVRHFLANEIRLANEIETIAEELGERYEELNLLYSTEDSLQYFDDPTSVTAQLVEKTNMHLNVDAVMLVIPGKNISVSHIEPDAGLTKGKLETLGTEILQHAQKTMAPVVANDDKDSDGGLMARKLGLKCLAIPMFDNRGTVEGVLAAFDNTSGRNFSNSDRNLIDVMARRVRWVLESARDSLTGLLARHAFVVRINAALAMSRATKATNAILYINIDKMHVINDMCGPHAGDSVICTIANIVDQLLEGENIAARLGGDEFGVLINNCTVKDATVLAGTICKKIAEHQFEWDSTPYQLSVSIGVGAITSATGRTEEVLGAAEIACAEAKAAGGGRLKVLQQNDTVLVMRQTQMKWIGRVRSALRDSRFELHAQAIQPLNADDQSAHYEVLIRMREDDGTLIMPDEFLPSAERYDLMPDIDRWVIEDVFARLAEYWASLPEDTKKLELKKCSWAINLSGQSMSDLRTLNFITGRLEHFALPAEMFCFEVTESAAVRNIGDARRLMASLRARGCKFSLDDFGTGVSSFAYLKNLPVDYLKIDGSFVRPLLEDTVSAAVVAAISQVGKALKLRTIAEFVETEEIAQRLQEIGVDFGQGYAFARPVNLQSVLESRASSLGALV